MTIPRLTREQLRPDVAAALEPRIQRLGYLGEFFRCTAHQPRALLAFMELTDALKDALPDRLTEVVALTVAAALDNRYERHQHERLCRKLGYDDEWIRAALALQPGTPPLSATESAVQLLTLSMLGTHGHGSAADLSAVSDAVGPEAAVAILMLVGRYATHSMIVNALQLEPPVASIFTESE